MSFNKEAYIRYQIIDSCLTNPQKPYPTMDELIDNCERKLGKPFAVSTIQKDIKAMKEDEMLGFLAPIKFKKSHNGYYYSKPDYTIRTIPLNETDIESLKAATDMLAMYSGSRVSENFGHAVEKIFASVNERFPEGNSKRRIIQTDIAPSHKGFEHFELFLHSAKDKIPVCFVHYSYQKRIFNSVIVHPIILKEFQNHWYLVGYSENHEEIRTFGLDRIYDPKLLKRKFVEPKEKSKEDYFKHVYGVYPLPNQVKQRILFSVQPMLSDFLQAHPIHESQKIRREFAHGQALISLELIPSQELINYFLSFNLYLRVLEPKWMKEQILEHHKSIIAKEEDLRFFKEFSDEDYVIK